jgi:hypothetical protein
MSDPDLPAADPILDPALEQLVARKASRAAASAPSFAAALAKSRSAQRRARRRLVAVVAFGVVILAGAAVGLGLGGLASHRTTGASPGSSSSAAPSPDLIAALRRPMHLPAVPAGAPCPISQTTTVAGVGALPGPGPVYPLTTTVGGVVYFDPATAPYGPGTMVTWVAAPGFRGPVLIRGWALRSGQPLHFGPDELPELVITTNALPTQLGPPGWAGLEDDFTVIPDAGCYGYQIDGPTFSTVITFGAVPAMDLAGALRRPLTLPRLASGAACPAATPRPVVDWSGPAIGPGPVYSVGYDARGNIRWAGSQQDGGWYYVKILWFETPGTGPFLIRGKQLDGPNEVGFGSDPVPSPELVLEASDQVRVANASPGWHSYVAYTRVRAPGCYAYQVDTGSGSETIAFEAGP